MAVARKLKYLYAPVGPILHSKSSVSFFSAGSLRLWGPERVCSVRTSLFEVAPRRDVLVIETPEDEVQLLGPRALSPRLRDHQYTVLYYLHNTTFCLVTRGDSYSSSFFYNSLMAGCLPVVISDLFTFSFKWLIPYSEFIIRVAENDFIKNPEAVLDHIIASYPSSKVEEMRATMLKYRPYWSYFTESRLPLGRDRDKDAHLADPLHQLDTNAHSLSLLLPLKLMLYEMAMVRAESLEINALASTSTMGGEKALSKAQKNQLQRAFCPDVVQYCRDSAAKRAVPRVLCSSHSAHCVGSVLLSPFHGNVDIPLDIPAVTRAPHKDSDPYLCKHTHRVVGFYKTVFVNQCVRVLWPLRPGVLTQPVDSSITPEERAFLLRFHNVNVTDGRGGFLFKDIFPPPTAQKLDYVLNLMS